MKSSVTAPVGYGAGYRRGVGLPQNARYADNSNIWVEEVQGGFLWSKQREIGDSIVQNRYTAVQSAHDTGKSFRAAGVACWWIDTKPDPFVVTTAPTWKQVNSILWREMRRAHRNGGLPGRINLDAEWYMGSDELVAFGRKPADYDQSAFQGIHALNVLVIIDEGCGVPRSLYEAADALATNKNARVAAFGNPDDPSSYFEELCRPGSGWNVIKISAFDTPAFTGEEVPDGLLDLLVSKEWVEERKRRWGVGSPIYQSKVLGEFPDITDDTLLTPKMIRMAQERELPSDMKGQLGVDVARFGDAETAIYRARGGRVRLVKVLHMADTMTTANTVAAVLRPFRGSVRANIDVVGVGGGVYDRLREMSLPVSEFNSSETPQDPERFKNRRAEAYWHVRDLADNGELDLPAQGEDDDLIAQLGSIRWKITTGGKILIESKEDMKERGLPSPDRADAAVMALASGNTITDFFIEGDEKPLQTDGLRYRPM